MLIGGYRSFRESEIKIEKLRDRYREWGLVWTLEKRSWRPYDESRSEVREKRWRCIEKLLGLVWEERI